MSTSTGKKSYHTKATGAALETVEVHSAPDPLVLYGSCFCPFVQRVWISLELKGLKYQYVETDPYRKTKEFLALNPRGLIPALKHGSKWSSYESTVLMEYLEDAFPGSYALLPTTTQPASSPGGAEDTTDGTTDGIDGAFGAAQARAHSRLWADHVNRKVIPGFYHVLRAQEAGEQAKEAEALRGALQELIDAADPRGPFFLGPRIGFVDVQLAPWLLRLRRVLGPYRGWPEPQEGSRWARWVDAVEAHDAVKATVSTDGLYLDSYERYAENRPGTSQVADAVNQGRGLP